MDALTGHIFELYVGGSGGSGGPSATWASPFIFVASAADEANGFVDLPDASFVSASLFVFQNGLAVSAGHDFTVAGNRVTFTTGCLREGDLIQIRYQK